MFAQLQNGAWHQLDGRDVEIGDVVASYQTVTLWSDEERAAAGIRTIVDDATEPPEGKQRGSYEIVDVAGVPTRVWNFVDLPPAPVPQSISDRQFAHGLWKQGVIDYDEALAFVKTGDIPPAMQGLIDAMPEEQRQDVTMLVSGSTIFERSHPASLALIAAFGWTAGQGDDFFRFAAQL